MYRKTDIAKEPKVTMTTMVNARCKDSSPVQGDLIEAPRAHVTAALGDLAGSRRGERVSS